MKKAKKQEETFLINREISWLSFNERVLQEAENPRVPLIERIRFLGIYSNNRDEFFRVRVANLRRMMQVGKKAESITFGNPEQILERIQQMVLVQQRKSDVIYQQLVSELAKNEIFIINETNLNEQQRIQVKTYFQNQVRPVLVPIMLDTAPGSPYLRDKSIFLFVRMSRIEGDKKAMHALIEIPSKVLSRFVLLPCKENRKYIILLDDVIRFCLDEIFALFNYDKFEAYTIKLTRDAEMEVDVDMSKSIVETMSNSLKDRKKGIPVRFVYDSNMPREMVKYLTKRLQIPSSSALIPGGRYHNFKDLMDFPDVGSPEMKYTKLPTLSHPALLNQVSMFEALKKRDVLLSYPYQSFQHLVDVLREAAIDPKVTEIKITLYRVARNSNIVNSLINAIRNGKHVTVVVELQARFDEENNLYWAQLLQEEGAKVIFGVPGLKVHAKIFLITRIEGKKEVLYARIGTGNFNESTSKVYTDHSLFTCDSRLTNEVSKVFTFFENNYKSGHYEHLLVSPFYMREKLLALVDQEISNAKEGKVAGIWLKVNNLVDLEFIHKLYQASQAGVKVKLIIRGMCSIMCGVPGVSENIEGISIVDRFLEHSRLFIFSNNDQPRFYISSADLMNRNLDGRAEVACPIYDEEVKRELWDTFQISWNDNVKARILDPDLSNQFKERSAEEEEIRSQEKIYEYFYKLKISDQ
ncbi:MAG: polyphosphate kinase 1 [Bacteroidia bacterium]|nr:polyphosphate kinase 1 [Bacteroidia bacterium]